MVLAVAAVSDPRGNRYFGGVGLGWGGVGHVNVRLHLRHEVDASWLMWGGVGWGGAC